MLVNSTNLVCPLVLNSNFLEDQEQENQFPIEQR
jgi:hypothetical protein